MWGRLADATHCGEQGRGAGGQRRNGGKAGGRERAGQEWPAVAHVLTGRMPGTEQISCRRGRGLPRLRAVPWAQTASIRLSWSLLSPDTGSLAAVLSDLPPPASYGTERTSPPAPCLSPSHFFSAHGLITLLGHECNRGTPGSQHQLTEIPMNRTLVPTTWLLSKESVSKCEVQT